MEQKSDQHGIGVGSASILLIFIVLALTVFSVLTLVTAQGELTAAEKSAEAAADYYAAERAATIKANDLKIAAASSFSEDEIRPAAEELGASVSEDASGFTFSFSEKIDDNRSLLVELRLENGEMRIISWKTIGKDLEYDDSMKVWDGSSLPFDTEE